MTIRWHVDFVRIRFLLPGVHPKATLYLVNNSLIQSGFAARVLLKFWKMIVHVATRIAWILSRKGRTRACVKRRLGCQCEQNLWHKIGYSFSFPDISVPGNDQNCRILQFQLIQERHLKGAEFPGEINP